MYLLLVLFLFGLIWTGFGALAILKWLEEATEIEDKITLFLQLEKEQPTVGQSARYFTNRMNLINNHQDLLALKAEQKERPRHFWFATVPSFLLLGPVLLIPAFRKRIG